MIRDERGFTIIEVMAAVFILAVAFLGLANVHVTSSKAHSLGVTRGTAALIATQEIESMRKLSYDEIQATDVPPKTIGGVRYTVLRTVTNVNLGKKVQVRVRWTDRFGEQELTTQSVISQVTNP